MFCRTMRRIGRCPLVGLLPAQVWPEAVLSISYLLFQDSVIETPAYADDFHPKMQLWPWSLAMAASILGQRVSRLC
jgi:hypothetical protein